MPGGKKGSVENEAAQPPLFPIVSDTVARSTKPDGIGSNGKHNTDSPRSKPVDKNVPKNKVTEVVTRRITTTDASSWTDGKE